MSLILSAKESLALSHMIYLLTVRYILSLDIFCNRKCRDNATDTQSQGDPKIVKRGPNFEQKGDQKGTFFDVKGDPKFNSFRIVHKERIC